MGELNIEYKHKENR